jgi:hypothetical protein
MKTWAVIPSRSTGSVWMEIAITAFTLGTIFWILKLAFRVTVTIWTAGHLAENNLLDPFFKTWMDGTNLIFPIYMVLAYFSIGCMGLVQYHITLLPSWVSWFV